MPKFAITTILELVGLTSRTIKDQLRQLEDGEELLSLLKDSDDQTKISLIIDKWSLEYRSLILGVKSCIDDKWGDAAKYFNKSKPILENNLIPPELLISLCDYLDNRKNIFQRLLGKKFSPEKALPMFKYCREVHAYLYWQVNKSIIEKAKVFEPEKALSIIFDESDLSKYIHDVREILIEIIIQKDYKITNKQVQILQEWLDCIPVEDHNDEFWRSLSLVFEKRCCYESACVALERITGSLWVTKDRVKLVYLYQNLGDVKKAFNQCMQLLDREEKMRSKLNTLFLELFDSSVKDRLKKGRPEEIKGLIIQLQCRRSLLPDAELKEVLLQCAKRAEEMDQRYVARDFYEAIHSFWIDDIEAIIGLLNYYFTQAEYGLCVNKFNLFKNCRNNNKCLVPVIRSLFELNDFQKAFELAQQLQDSDNYEMQDLFEKALTKWTNQLFDSDSEDAISKVKAYYMARKSKALEDCYLDLLKRQIRILIKQRCFDKAHEILINIMRDYPRREEFYIELASLEEARGLRKQAIKILEEYNYNANSHEIERKLLDLYFADGQYSKALESYKILYGQGKIKDPNLRYKIYFNLSRKLLDMAKNSKNKILFKEALEKVNEALSYSTFSEELEEMRRKIYIELAQEHFYDENYEDAIKYFEYALRYLKEQDYIIRQLAKAHSYLGYWDEAIKYWTKLKDEIEPGNSEIYRELIGCYIKKKDYDQARLINQEHLQIFNDKHAWSSWNRKIDAEATKQT